MSAQDDRELEYLEGQLESTTNALNDVRRELEDALRRRELAEAAESRMAVRLNEAEETIAKLTPPHQ